MCATFTELVRVSWLVMHSVKSPCVSQLRGGLAINVEARGGGFGLGLDAGGGVVGVDPPPPPPQALSSSTHGHAALATSRLSMRVRHGRSRRLPVRRPHRADVE